MMKHYCSVIFALILIAIFPTSFAEGIILHEEELTEGYELGNVMELNEEWLYAQADAASSNTYKDVITALYIINSTQYGPYDNYEDITGTRPNVDQLCEWLDSMSFEYTAKDIHDGLRRILLNDVYIDIFSEDNIIKRMDLTVNDIQNGYGKNLLITVTFD